MSYSRVIPRDLFNEASLLKCYAQMYINLEGANAPGVELRHNGRAFDVRQDASSGSISLANVTLIVRGKSYCPRRPLNSREAWPLYIDDGDEEVEVFTDTGKFSPSMLAFLRTKL